MAKKKRVTRKQLLKEPDEFLTLSARALRYSMDHKDRIGWGLGLLVAVGVIIAGANYFLATAENKAFELLDQSMSRYAAAVEADGPIEAVSRVEEGFQQLVDGYGKRNGGKIGRLIYADICFKGGQLDRSIELSQQALKDFGNSQPYKNLILSSLGTAYEEKEDYEAAVGYFERITSEPEGLMRNDALFSLGRIYAAMDRKGESTATYKKLIADYPGYMNIEIARDMLIE